MSWSGIATIEGRGGMDKIEVATSPSELTEREHTQLEYATEAVVRAFDAGVLHPGSYGISLAGHAAEEPAQTGESLTINIYYRPPEKAPAA